MNLENHDLNIAADHGENLATIMSTPTTPPTTPPPSQTDPSYTCDGNGLVNVRALKKEDDRLGSARLYSFKISDVTLMIAPKSKPTSYSGGWGVVYLRDVPAPVYLPHAEDWKMLNADWGRWGGRKGEIK